jgi:hypothetical protein
VHYRAAEAGHVELVLYDLAGRRVAERSQTAAAEGTIPLDTSDLGAGVYVLRLTMRGADAKGAGASVTRRIAVVR